MGKITITVGDITLFEGDAIVNAANTLLLGGGGVDGAIHRAAGRGLLNECRQLNGCKTGESKITAGYNLPAQYVIHTVGPVWHGGKSGEPELLASCYRTALTIALSKGFKSIAFPCISTGIFHYPKEEAARIALKTIREMLSNHDLEVTIVCFTEADKAYYDQIFQED